MDELIGLEEQAKRGFCQQALAFMEIADGQHYRKAGYKDFDTYCKDRANISDRHGWRLVQAGTLVQELIEDAKSKGEDPPWLPVNERQAREFARIRPPKDSSTKPDLLHAVQVVYDYAPKKNGEPVMTADTIRETLTQQKFITPPRQKAEKDKAEAERRRKARVIQKAFRAVHELKAELSPKQAVRYYGDEIFTSAYEGAVAYLLELEELRNQ